MRHFILSSLITVLCYLTLEGQINNICSYNSPNTVYETINLNPNNSENLDALLLIRKMLKPIGLEANFIPLKINGINNCAAITKNGLRLIIYDDLFLQKLNSFSNTDWIKVSVFAHEIGHHLNGHTLFFALSAQGKRDNELQADEFSGFLMQKLGSTIEQAKAGMEILGSEDDSDTHPAKDKRLFAIEKGYKKALSQENDLLTRKPPNAEKYFIEASEMYNLLLKNSNYFASSSINNRVNSINENEILDKILENLSAAIKINPIGDDIYILRSFVRFLQHNIDGTERDLSEALRLNPKNYLAYYKLAEIELEKRNYEKGLMNINQSISYNANFSSSYLLKGIILSKLKKHEEAINIYNRAIEIDSKNSMLYSNRGFSLFRTQKKDEAKRDFQKSIELDPYNGMAFFELGQIYYFEESYNDAIKMHSKAIEINSKYSDSYYIRGLSFIKLNKKDEAKRDFEKSMELDSNNDMTFFELGKIYQAEKNYKEAINMFTKAILINSKFAEAYNRRGEVYSWGLMDKEEALKDFDRAIELDSKFPYPYKNRGYIHFFNNDFEKAIIDLDRAYELDPAPFGDGFRVLFHKGKARIQIKDFKKGFEDVKESVFYFELYLKDSNDSFLKGMLAEAYYLCAYAANELSMEEEEIKYLKKGCEIGVKECCEALKQAKK